MSMVLSKSVKWVANAIKPLVDDLKEKSSKVDATYSYGLNISASLLFCQFEGQIGFAMDTKGNIAIQATGASNVTTSPTLSVSISRYDSVTNAPTVNDLNGPSYQLGGSFTFPVEGVNLVGGTDLNVIPNDSNSYYYGLTTCTGLALVGTPGLEGHLGQSITETIPYSQINVFDITDYIYNRIMEW